VEEYLKRSVGERIAALRRERGLSLSELAERAGVSKSTLYEIEMGRVAPSVTTLWKIANALEVGFGALVPEWVLVSERSVDVLLIERGDGFEAYLMRLKPYAVHVSRPHVGVVSEYVFVAKGAAVVGPVDSPIFLREGEATEFPGNVPHFYAPFGGETRLIVRLVYAQKESAELPLGVRVVKRPPGPLGLWSSGDVREFGTTRGRYIYRSFWAEVEIAPWLSEIHKRLLQSLKNIDVETLKKYAEGDGPLKFLAVETLAYFGIYMDVNVSVGSAETTFGEIFSPAHYARYEVYHPGYGRQIVYINELVERLGVREVLDVGTGPGYHLFYRADCVEPEAAFWEMLKGKCRQVLKEFDVSRSYNAVVAMGSPHRIGIEVFLEKVSAVLKSGGFLIVADEFPGEFKDEEERVINVARHHAAYVLDIWPRDVDPALAAPLLEIYLARDMARVVEHAAAFRAGLELAQGHPFVEFAKLEALSMYLGMMYYEEKKTHLAEFVSLAKSAGFRLVEKSRVYHTYGDGGTYVLLFERV